MKSPLLETQIKNRLIKAQEKLAKAEDELMMWNELLKLANKEQRQLT